MTLYMLYVTEDITTDELELYKATHIYHGNHKSYTLFPNIRNSTWLNQQSSKS
jgi:hypothetical protein